MYCYVCFFCFFPAPQMMMELHHPISSPPRASPVTPPRTSLIILLGRILFGCCVFLQWQPPKAKAPFLLPFFIDEAHCRHAKKKQQPTAAQPILLVGASYYGPIGSHGAMIQ